MIALILGGAQCVWDDAYKFQVMVEFCDEQIGAVIAVNDIGMHWQGPLHFWCSLHPEKMQDWEDGRARNGLSSGYVTISHKNSQKKDGWKPKKIMRADLGGSSGLLAWRVARDIVKADRIVLAGVPMDSSGHFFDPKPWVHYNSHRHAWSSRYKLLKPITRSMSGWTAKNLGVPTPEWLRRQPDVPKAITGEGNAS
jgi:hypothetical protein